MTRYAACAALSIAGLPCVLRMHPASQIGLLQVEAAGLIIYQLLVLDHDDVPLLAEKAAQPRMRARHATLRAAKTNAQNSLILHPSTQSMEEASRHVCRAREKSQVGENTSDRSTIRLLIIFQFKLS